MDPVYVYIYWRFYVDESYEFIVRAFLSTIHPIECVMVVLSNCINMMQSRKGSLLHAYMYCVPSQLYAVILDAFF